MKDSTEWHIGAHYQMMIMVVIVVLQFVNLIWKEHFNGNQ